MQGPQGSAEAPATPRPPGLTATAVTTKSIDSMTYLVIHYTFYGKMNSLTCALIDF